MPLAGRRAQHDLGRPRRVGFGHRPAQLPRGSPLQVAVLQSLVRSGVASLSLWIDDRVAAATASGSHELDLESLLQEGGNLYLVAPTEAAERCRPLFTALLQLPLLHL